MPIYEFRCRACGKKTTELVLVRERISDVRCKHCASADLERLWSRFATVKSEESRLDSLADSAALDGIDENDPKSMMRWMKRMGQEMGEDLGDDFEDAMEQELAAAERGEESPETGQPAAGEAGTASSTGDDEP